MTVERRYNKRYPISGDVYIRYRKQRVFSAKAVNFSQHGMYLETENLTLLKGGWVELELFRQGRQWQIAGIVTHCRKNSLGVMFWRPQAEFYESVLGEAKLAASSSFITLPLLPADRTPRELLP